MEHDLSKTYENSFYNHIILSAVFFLFTPIALFTSLFSLLALSKNDINKPSVKSASTGITQTSVSGVRVYASLPSSLPSISGEPETKDARTELIKKYLDFYQSPLYPYAELIVVISDQNQLDYRLLTAIAQQESNLCKKIPAGTFNCWGWGIHSKGTLGFSSYEEGIITVAKGLKENYVDQGLTSIDDIMGKYTPLSEGTWSFGVSKFMGDMEIHY